MEVSREQSSAQATPRLSTESPPREIPSTNPASISSASAADAASSPPTWSGPQRRLPPPPGTATGAIGRPSISLAGSPALPSSLAQYLQPHTTGTIVPPTWTSAPSCPAELLFDLSTLLNGNHSKQQYQPPLVVSSLDTRSTFEKLAVWRVKRAPARADLWSCPDGVYDLFYAHSQRRYVGQVVQSRFAGAVVLFLSNRGVGSLNANERPHDYEKRLRTIGADEQRQPGQPSDVVKDVRPAFIKDKACAHEGCGTSLLFRARHHCRACGHSFCFRHSRFRTPLAGLYYPLDDPQKVCDRCFKESESHGQMLHGDLFLGQHDATHGMHGWGCLLSEVDGTASVGRWEQGQLMGDATVFYSKPFARVYEGQVVRGVPHGRGRMLFLDPHDTAIPALSPPVPGKTEQAVDEWVALLRVVAMSGKTVEAVAGLYVDKWAEGVSGGNGVALTRSCRYQGDVVRGALTGVGLVVSASGDVYSGQVQSGRKHGQGVLHAAAERLWYGGSFEQDERRGEGITHFADGSVYSGQHALGMAEGRGRMHYASRAMYEGSWSQGRRHGSGELVMGAFRCHSLRPSFLPSVYSVSVSPSPSDNDVSQPAISSVYCSWVADAPSGPCRVVYSEGLMYYGPLAASECTGEAGQTDYANGDVYRGSHVCGYRHGRGSYSYKELATTFDGSWDMGARMGSLPATVIHRKRNEVFQGLTAYLPAGRWFAGEGRLSQSVSTVPALEPAQRPSFTCFSAADVATLSRHGFGLLSRPQSGGVKRIKAEWQSDLQDGEGQWALRDGMELRGTWQPLSSNGRAVFSVLVGPATIVVPASRRSLTVAVVSTCLLPLPASGSPTADTPCSYLQDLLDSKSDAVAAAGHSAARKLGPDQLLNSSLSLSSASAAQLQPSVAALPPLALLLSSLSFVLCGVSRVVLESGEELSSLFIFGRADGWGRWQSRPVPAVDGGHSSVLAVGQWKGGLLHGIARVEGSASSPESSSAYVGHFSSGRRHGQGRLAVALSDGAAVLDGEWKDGLPDGVGVLRCSSVQFSGCLQSGRISEGEARTRDGLCYSGQWQNARPHGVGRLSSPTGSFTGDFVDGRLSGRGLIALHCSVADAAIDLLYEGEVLDGQLHGRGTLQWRRRTTAGQQVVLYVHHGRFRHSLANGAGSARLFRFKTTTSALQRLSCQPLTPPSQDTMEAELSTKGCEPVWQYTGMWRRGLFHGWGHKKQFSQPTSHATLNGGPATSPSSSGSSESSYVGTFVDGVMSGLGRLDARSSVAVLGRAATVQSFSGVFVAGLPSSRGSLLFADGSCYIGALSDGRPDGFGEMAFANGTKLVDACWRAGRLHGKAKLLFESTSSTGADRKPLPHSIESIHCGFVNGRLFGVQTFYFAQGADASPIASISAVLLEREGAYTLSPEHGVRVSLRRGGHYTGQIKFASAAVGPTQFEWLSVDPLLAGCSDLLACLSSASLSSPPSLSAAEAAGLHLAEAMVSSLPPAGASPAHRGAPTAASLLSVARQTGDLFPLHALSLFLSRADCIRDGAGYLGSADGKTIEYAGGWVDGRMSGWVSWSRRDKLGWPALVAWRQANRPTEGAKHDQPGPELVQLIQYAGEMEAGQCHGLGQLVLHGDGLVLAGYWQADRLVTDGCPVRIVDLTRRTQYEGAVSGSDLAFDGLGTLRHFDRSVYRRHVGSFHRGLAHGLGVREYDHGTFTGSFHADKRHGAGRWDGADGRTLVGHWKDDSLVHVGDGKATSVPTTATPLTITT